MTSLIEPARISSEPLSGEVTSNHPLFHAWHRLRKTAGQPVYSVSNGARELIIMAPLVACIFWIGFYPKPILDRIETSTQALVEQVQNEVFGATRVELPAAVTITVED